MRRAASALLAAALILNACASAATPSATTRPSSPAATRYLELAAVWNAETCTFNATLSQSAPRLEDLVQGSTTYADGLATLIDGLRGIDWPAGIAGDANDLIDALAADLATARTMAAAESLAAFIAADNQLIAHNQVTAGAAHRLRQDLGLPSGGDPCAT
jgi:hypothetical protein